MKRALVGRAMLLLALLILPNHSNALCVDVSTANIRSGPGKGYDVIWEVYRYMPLQKVGISLSGDWYAVTDLDGEVGWIHKSLLSSRNRCAVVKTDTARIRSGPGLSYAQKFKEPAVKYEGFKVLQMKSGWAKLEDEQKKFGWIDRDLLWMQ